eukprot:TRINITY_DN983_c0_g2_i6.p1 TRINITY_DN983_c0_g2~~TRINITY_DN983_c0_g2_i6.p1  ORF type:complete len:370 (+),score=64.72 TRINITY_DN983_c0_g2_i6:109-1218(+)
MALSGLRVVEFCGIGPGPFLGTMLADFGADVLCIDRLQSMPMITCRGKRIIRADLKDTKTVHSIKQIITKSDVLIDPYRPGVMEKLGLGPTEMMILNPALIYARLTGFGQNGPYASMAGHDINYVAMSGTLSKLGRPDSPPIPPGNILADFAGGSLTCAWGILLALYEREKSGKGQVIDSAMMDGVLYLSSFLWEGQKNGLWDKPRGQNVIDSGAPYYDVYTTKDGKWISIGAIEPQFYRILVKKLELEEQLEGIQQYNTKKWPEMRQIFAEKIKTKTRDEWQQIFDGSDACVVPVLEFTEVLSHPHGLSRRVLMTKNRVGPRSKSVALPRPAPRLSRTPGRENLENSESTEISLEDIISEISSVASKL